jgi:predicted aspartyl protease
MLAHIRLRSLFLGFTAFACSAALIAQSTNCSVAQPHPLTEEQQAIIRVDLPRAETLYRQKIAQLPKDPELIAGLVRTLLDEQKVDEAESTVKAALTATPQSVELMTALAEVQYRQGLPWAEEKTLAAAERINLCYARLHLVFAEYYRFNSYYAAALAKIKLAHQLDPYDPDIQRAWITTLPLKQRIEELKAYLAAKDTDVDALRHAQRQLAILEDRLENRTKSCHLTSPITTTEIPFTAIMADATTIRGWGLEVFFNDHKSRLQVDTGASGLYISRPVAERAGLKPITRSEASGIGNKGSQGGYIAYADSIKIGGLEFKDCLVEVSDRRNVVDTDGLIGMDVFSDFLVTLDFPWHKLTLGPLPPYPGATAALPALNTQEETPTDESDSAATSSKDAGAAPAPRGPHDRYIAPEMQQWTSVYRVGHDLIVPTALNNKRVRLFIIDTGAFNTSISPGAAREVTRVFTDPESTVKGISGNVSKVYIGDSVTFRFSHLQQEKKNVLSFDTSSVSRDVGTEISGFIGFDLLGLLVVKIDYRDGLMSFEYSADRGYQHIRDSSYPR